MEVSKNVTDEGEFISESLWYTVSQGILLPSSLVTNAMALTYINFRLRINQNIATIFIIDTWTKITLQLAALTGYCLIHVGKVRNVYVCSLYTHPSLLGLVSFNVYPTATSIVRYHMATRIANQQLFQRRFIQSVTALAVFLVIANCFWLFSITFGDASFGPVVDICYKRIDSPDYKPSPKAAIPAFMVAAIASQVGIGFDLAMYRFIRKRRVMVKPEVAMVSWNVNDIDHQPQFVSSGSNDPYAKALVPIKATCLGFASLCATGLLFVIVLYGLSLEEDLAFRAYFLHDVGIVGSMIHMPLILWLTVKSKHGNSSRVKRIQPPQGLQFHD